MIGYSSNHLLQFLTQRYSSEGKPPETYLERPGSRHVRSSVRAVYAGLALTQVYMPAHHQTGEGGYSIRDDISVERVIAAGHELADRHPRLAATSA